MAWQPLYGTCWDDVVGNGHTSSLRGIVSSVGLDCKTAYGKCVEVNVGYTDGKENVDKLDLRKVKKELREKAKMEYKENIDKKTKINVDVSLKDDAHFKYYINGVEVNMRVLQLLSNNKSESFLMVVDRLLQAAEKESNVSSG